MSVDRAQVEATLARRRGAHDKPSQEDLVVPFDYLRTTFVSTRNLGSSATAWAPPHWYCSKADKLERDVAVYLIFIFAFSKSGDNAVLWLQEVKGVLRCEACAKAFGGARREFRKKYLCNFPSNVITNFFLAVDRWTVDYVNEALATSLGGLPRHLLHLVMSEPSLLQNEQINKLVETTIEDREILPSSELSPVLVRLLSKHPWAKVQLSNCSPAKMVGWRDGVGEEIQATYNQPAVMRDILRSGALDPQTIEEGVLGKDSLMGALVPRLTGSAEDYPDVFGCFLALLQLRPKGLWSYDPSPDLPHTLFAGIKNNPSYLALLEHDPTTASEFIEPFVMSLTHDSNTRAFGETLAKTANFCFAELQQARISQSVRAKLAQVGFETLSAVERVLDRDSLQFKQFSATVDVHASFIANVAFRPKDYPDHAEAQSRAFISAMFRSDGKDILESVHGLASIVVHERQRLRYNKHAPIPVTALHLASIRKTLWDAAYNAVSPKDAAGVALLMDAISSVAFVEMLDSKNAWAFDRSGDRKSEVDQKKNLSAVIDADTWASGILAVNSGLKHSREHIGHLIESFSLQPRCQDQFARGLAGTAVTLLFSPVDELNESALMLIQQAYEVDDRAECFRVLLRHHPFQAIDAMTRFLQDFTSLANVTPESCSLAKRLVRCFADIIDALCSSVGGQEPLLASESFMSSHRKESNMRRCIKYLWHLMTKSLSVIFRRTISWAPLFENDDMIDWMRDALIFGSHLCDKVRLFEAAVLGTETVPTKVSNQGKTLLAQLHVVLRDLVSWLRLTDVETLYQTFELIKFILSRTTASNFDVHESEQLLTSVTELDKYCRQTTKSYTSKLTDDRISELSELLAPLRLEPEDEVEFVAESPVPSSSGKPAEKTQKTDALEVMMNRAKDKAAAKAVPRKDAFAMLMGKPSKTIPKPTPQSRSVSDDDDDFLAGLSANDLDVLEKRAQIAAKTGKTMAGKIGSSSKARPILSAARAAVTTPKLNINVVPRPKPSKPSAMTGLMRQLHNDHRHEMRSRPPLGGVVPKLPTASSAGTGLGAYVPPSTRRPVEESDTSDSSDSDDGGGGLSQLVKKMKSPKRFEMPVVRKVQRMDARFDMMSAARRKEEAERAQKARMKARLHPDPNPLFREVLAWTPSTQPTFAKADYIPTVFPNADRYDNVMLPLFLRELWAQSENQKEEFPPVAVEVTTRAYEADWIEIQLSIVGKWPEKMYLNDSDIVILSQPDSNPIYAKIQHVKRSFKEANVKVRIVGAMDQPGLLSRSKWFMQKHISLSTALREFGALRGLPFYEPSVLHDILNANSAKMPAMSEMAIRQAMTTYDVNEPQAKAIIGATQISGFALIQGPPGTGKTKTISGLVGKWLSTRSTPIDPTARRAKLLVCAPSNAAIDEVCKRLQNGVNTEGGGHVVPMIVRIGIDNSVNDAVKDRSLDNLVEARVSSAGEKSDSTEYGRIQIELEQVKSAMQTKQRELEATSNEEKRRDIETAIHELGMRRVKLAKNASKAKDAMRDSSRHLDGARRAAREAVLKEADVICATLSGAGQDILAAHEFDTVIIDEAAQAIELACLIPLRYGCKRCIMVGDPNQLPPTTFSPDAEKLHYNESLFVRMAKRQPENMHLLSIQYRMHPDISELPSKVFYQSMLKDGPDMRGKTAAVWHERSTFGPYRFFNVEGFETRAGTSTKNSGEATVAVELYRRLEADFGKKINLAMRIGIISMYREQVFEIRRAFNQAYGPNIMNTIDTVDGFQGQEKDIIILSTVRSGPGLTSIGFLRDQRRMNVALTRAKSSLFVIGNAATLERCDERWRTIVGDARERGFLINYKSDTFAAAPPAPPASTPASTSASASATPVAKKVKKEHREKSEKSSLKRKHTDEMAEKSVQPPVNPDVKPVPVKAEPLVSVAAPRQPPPPTSRPPDPPSARPPPIPSTARSKPIPVHPGPARPQMPVRPPVAAPKPEDVAFRKKKKRPNNPTVTNGMASRPLPSHSTLQHSNQQRPQFPNQR